MNNFKKHLFLVLYLLAPVILLNAHENADTIVKNEIQLADYFKILSKLKNDEQKLTLNKKIDSLFFNTLQLENSFNYAFDSLKNVGKLISDDKLVRIFTWNIPLHDGTHNYFGYLYYFNKEEKEYDIIRLIDNPQSVINPETAVLKPSDWYGTLYYQLIQSKYNGKKYYTLLGFDFNNIFTNKKIIEVLYFNDQNEPVFGKPIFKYNNKLLSRIIFEYSSRATMVLRYNDDLNMIVFDHLSPSSPSFEGNYQYYGPDFSYDGLKFEDGLWNYQKDIQIHN